MKGRRFHCGLVLWVMFGLSVVAVRAGEEPSPKDAPVVKEAPAAAPVPERATPRATMRTFLTAMVDYEAAIDPDANLRKAAACLDLKGAGVPESEGGECARQLKSVLDRLWYVDPNFKELHEDPDGPEFRKVLTRDGRAYGEVVLAALPDRQWKFSAVFVKQIPALAESVRRLDYVSLGLWLEDKMPPALKKTTLLLKQWQWLGLLLLILLGVVLDRVVGWIVGFFIARWLARMKIQKASDEAARLERPAGLAAMALLWWIGLYWLNLSPSVHEFLGCVAVFFLAGAGVWTAYRAVDVLAAWLAQAATRTETKMDDLLIPLVRKTLKIFVVVFGLVFVADNLGVNVTTLLAGLGIGGIAFALAAKDTVENLFGSLTVLTDRPFQIGDWVVIGDVEGTVEEVGFRSTRVRTFYNSLVTLPNSKLVNAHVDNYGARKKRRVKMTLGVTYSTPAEKVEAFCEGIRELIRLHPYTAKDFYLVHFNEYADCSLNILLYCFHITPDWATELRERERLLLDIKRLAERLGVDFAFPTQTLHIETLAAPAPLPARKAAELPQAVQVDSARALGRREATALVKELVGLGTVPEPVEYPNPEQHLVEVKEMDLRDKNPGS